MYQIFNPALSGVLERLSSEPSLVARIHSSIERLKSALPKKDDVIIIDMADIEPPALRDRLSSLNAMIALYDPDKIDIPRLLSYQHTVYLPYDYSGPELGRAMEDAERIRDEIGTLKDMLVGDSEVMEALRRTIERIIKTKQRIFHISGDTGTGKNLVVQYIKQACLPKSRKSVYESCGALDGELAESRFFGHAKGAYTGATDQVDGIGKGLAGKSAGHQLQGDFRKNHSRRRDDRCEKKYDIQEVAAEAFRIPAARAGQFLIENRNKGRGDRRPNGHVIQGQRQAAGGIESVCHGGGAVITAEQHIPHQPQHLGEHHRQNQQDILPGYSPFFLFFTSFPLILLFFSL